MRIRLITVALLSALSTSQAEKGFQVYELKGYSDLPRIPKSEYTVHQHDRPRPQYLTPPKSDGKMGQSAPSDAKVLFDGSSLDQFQPSAWPIVEGNLIAETKGLVTKDSYGDFQMHIEWKTPSNPSIHELPGQIGNSGLYIMGRYELQIYDSYSSKIYADGGAGAIYGQTPPLVNACRKPGEWQSYEIVFTAPVFEDETLISPARLTALHNGVLVQNNTEILGPTTHKDSQPYKAHPAKLPLVIQAHNSPVAFRNIWIREL